MYQYCRFTYIYHLYIQASKRYLAVARSMKAYEDDRYSEWLENVETSLPVLLKKTVLTKPPIHQPSMPRSRTPASNVDSRAVSRMDFSYILPPSEPICCYSVCVCSVNDIC